jgi:hypothetical protein
MFATQDGGRTWKQDRTLSNLVEDETVKSTVAGSIWMLPFAPQGTQPKLVKLSPNDRIKAESHESNGAFNLCGLSFLTKDEGWMNCAGELSFTIDGGASWTSITPRIRNGALTQDPVTPIKSVPVQMKATPLASPVKTKPMSLVPPTGNIPSGIDQRLGFDSYRAAQARCRRHALGL